MYYRNKFSFTPGYIKRIEKNMYYKNIMCPDNEIIIPSSLSGPSQVRVRVQSGRQAHRRPQGTARAP